MLAIKSSDETETETEALKWRNSNVYNNSSNRTILYGLVKVALIFT